MNLARHLPNLNLTSPVVESKYVVIHAWPGGGGGEGGQGEGNILVNPLCYLACNCKA